MTKRTTHRISKPETAKLVAFIVPRWEGYKNQNATELTIAKEAEAALGFHITQYNVLGVLNDLGLVTTKDRNTNTPIGFCYARIDRLEFIIEALCKAIGVELPPDTPPLPKRPGSHAL